MGIAQQVEMHLPYMRRFARALCGNQASGDAYVATVIETLISAPDSVVVGIRPKAALYNLLLKLWNSVSVNMEAGAVDGNAAAAAADRSLDSITPKARQAFLLVAMEDFDTREAAQILEISEIELSQLIDEAGRQMAEQVATDVLIIEDEPLIAIDLAHIMTSLGHKVVSTARTHGEALAAVQHGRPGLVLADINLADGSSGIDAVNDLLKTFHAPVIFITSYPERLLTGERPEPTFLITKPFQHEMIKAIASQALFFDRKAKPYTAA
ncbi:MAG: response regulator [Hyphomicrobiales bacterium]|nr:response regulator [Hyphomicrobiales bacterium]